MRTRVVGKLTMGQHKLVRERAWPCAHLDHTPREAVALAYLRGMTDAAEAMRGEGRPVPRHASGSPMPVSTGWNPSPQGHSNEQ